MSLLSTTNPIYKNDPIVSKIIESFQKAIDSRDIKRENLKRQFLIETADESLGQWEKRYAVKINSTDIDDRRNAVQAKMWSFGNVNIDLIRKVANAWKNGEVNVVYEDEEIKLSFVSSIGIPNDLGSLIAAIDEIIPAHFGLSYTINYLLIRDIELMTLEQLERQPLSSFAF